MANFDRYFDTLIAHEGRKFVNNIYDRGGATKMGITLNTWIKLGFDKDGDGDIDVEDLKLITEDDVRRIGKKNYWDKVGGDYINSQSVAEFLFDWAYNSGPSTAVKKVQVLLEGIRPDGVIGPKTIEAINMNNAEALFYSLKDSREAFYRAIVRADKSQEVFLKGWLVRNNSIKFEN